MTEAPERAELRRIKYGTVGDRLGDISLNLLPERVLADPNVQWVLSYKNLGLEAHVGSDPKQIAYQAAVQMVASLLEERLPFYKGTLFYIGRQLKISDALGKEALRLLDERNLAASVENMIAFINKAGRDSDPHLVRENIIAVSNAAADRHGRSLKQAKAWWAIWVQEVADLRETVRAFEEQAPRSADDDEFQQHPSWLRSFSSFLFVQQRPSRIRYVLRDEGVAFRDNVDPWSVTTAAVTVLLPLMFSFVASTRGFDPRWIHELQYLIRELQIEPAIRETEARLRSQYGSQNPFDEFAVGRKAATEQLVELIKENTLEDGRLSEWARAWQRTLESDGEFARPSAYEALAPERIEFAIRSADSAIKQGLVGRYSRRSPIETFPEHLQRMFEEKWVTHVGYSIFRQDLSSNRVWTVASLESLLLVVVQGLNAIGYTFVVPATDRLEALATQAEQGVLWYNLKW
ncbi:hypothetical protein [Bradyrhizobium liaoningense]